MSNSQPPRPRQILTDPRSTGGPSPSRPSGLSGLRDPRSTRAPR